MTVAASGVPAVGPRGLIPRLPGGRLLAPVTACGSAETRCSSHLQLPRRPLTALPSPFAPAGPSSLTTPRGRRTARRVLSPLVAAAPASLELAGDGVEMGGLAYLLSLCAVMFLGGYGAGMLPLVVQISESRLRLVTAFGAGLLVGTALAVIIPEGFAALEEAGSPSHTAPVCSSGTGSQAILMEARLTPGLGMISGCICSPASSPRASGAGEKDIDGFVALEVSTAQQPSANQDPAFRALVGLVIHSAADGFAVGTATTSDNAMLSSMVGLAMVMHKAPVAFGLATYLLSAKWSWQRANRGILVFSVASPVTALVTYGVLRHIPMLSTPLAIALCVLFSGGTFLYASCIHILPEVKGKSESFSRGQLAAIFIGSLIPLFLASFHAHGGGGHDHRSL